jgi:acrylyl-CoA reductase (NADPH)
MSDQTFNAMMLREEDKKTRAAIEKLSFDALPGEDTLVKIEYSTINFKDALAVTGKGKIVKTWPLVPGIDFSGEIVETSNPNLQAGQKVVLTGWSVGEKYWGGYSQYQRVRGEWLVPLPDGLTTRQAMMIGTAGFTGMLCVNALEDAGITPASGPVLVTGAAGGVGSVAVAILSKLGYDVTALTGNEAKHAYVSGLGAKAFADGPQWADAPRALEAQKWSAAIDTVGSKVLARVLAEMNYNGVVAACGLAGGADLPTTVMPFILRGVSILGIHSVEVPHEWRQALWRRLAGEWSLKALNDRLVHATVDLEGIPGAAAELVAGRALGRYLVHIGGDS